MSSVPRHQYTVFDYMYLEENSIHKHEYYRGEIFAMPGGTPNHSRIILNIGSSIHQLLKNRQCQAFESNMRVATDDEFYTYPDLSVVCDEPEFLKPHPTFKTVNLLNPTLLVEVLSESTEQYDRTGKFELYQQIPSFRQYVLIAQDRHEVEVLTKNDSGEWDSKIYTQPNDVCDLSEIACQVPLTEIYDKVVFE